MKRGGKTDSRFMWRVVLFAVGGTLLFVSPLLLFAQYMNSAEARDLERRGVRATATVTDLSGQAETSLSHVRPVTTTSSYTYRVGVHFQTADGQHVTAETTKFVGQSEFERLSVGDRTEVVYAPESPSGFVLAASLERLRGSSAPYAVISLFGLGGLVLVIFGVKLRRK